jgi:adenylate kinase
MLILITGVPGTGKTTVAAELCKILKAEEIDIKELALKGKFLMGYDAERKSMIINERKISKAVKKHMKAKKNYVVASHMAHFVSPRLAKLCVVLRCNPDVLKKRMSHRGYSEDKISENIMCEYLDALLIEAIRTGHKKHLHEIDTTKSTPLSVAKEIVAVINGKKKKSFGKISWLA